MRFVTAAANQAHVLVGFEIGHPHDDLAREYGSGQRGHALGNFIHIEIDRRGITGDTVFDFLTDVFVLTFELEQCFRMDADLAIDDKFHARQADAFAGQAGERESQFGIAHVHHDFHRRCGHVVQSDVADFHIQQTVVNKAGVAFGTRNRYFLAFLQDGRGVAATDYGRNTQFARNNRRMAGTSATVGNDGCRAFHYRLPIRVGHIGNQYVAFFHAVHLGSVFHQAHFALADLLADGPAFGQYFFLTGNRITAQAAAAFLLGFNGFGAGLQNIDFTVHAVAAPLDVHRAAVVFFDNQRILCQLGNFFVTDGKLFALLGRNVHHLHGLACLSLFGKHHFNQFRTHGFTQHGGTAGTQSRFVDIEFVGVYRALNHHFAQTVGRGHKDDLIEAAFGIQRKHYARSAAVGAHHALHACRQSHDIVRETFVDAVGNGAVIVKRSENVLHGFFDVVQPVDIQEGFLLSGKRGIRQVFGGGG